MEMCYSGALVMPSSYAMMDEEDMTYVEGWGVPRTGAIMLVDTMLMLTPLGAAFAPFKYIGKAGRKSIS